MYRGRRERLRLVEGTADLTAAGIQHMGIDHRCFHTGMSQKLLNGTDVVAGLEQVRSERMTQGVSGRPSADARRATCCFEGAGDGTFMQVPADLPAGAWIETESGGGKDELPGPLLARAGGLAVKSVGEGNVAEAACQVALVQGLDAAQGSWAGSRLIVFAAKSHKLQIGHCKLAIAN
jgi:hypothetical protein